MNIVINTTLPATASIVQNLLDNNVASLPTLFLGDQHYINIAFGNGVGGFADFTGKSNAQLRCGVGVVENRQTFTSANQRGITNGYYLFLLDLNTNELKANMAGVTEKTLDFEVQISYADGTTETLCQVPVQVRNTLISTNTSPQAPSQVQAQ